MPPTLLVLLSLVGVASVTGGQALIRLPLLTLAAVGTAGTVAMVAMFVLDRVDAMGGGHRERIDLASDQTLP